MYAKEFCIPPATTVTAAPKAQKTAMPRNQRSTRRMHQSIEARSAYCAFTAARPTEKYSNPSWAMALVL